MNDKNTIKKVLGVAISNFIRLISSVLIGFIIPKLLGVVDYGYYKIFILYMSYIGFFHFGFIDGIYLKYGGEDYEKLDKYKFRYYFKFLVFLETIIAILIILYSIIFIGSEKQFIFILLAINLLSINLTTYFQFISQITSRFKEYSMRTIIISLFNIIIVTILFLFNFRDYKIYIILIVTSNFIILFWYLVTYKKISFGKSQNIKLINTEILSIFRNGIPLLLSNLAITLVLMIDKQFVELNFPLTDFSIYSFAFSMLSLITVFISAIGIVLYPILKKTDNKNIKKNYTLLNRLVLVFMAFGIIIYFPMKWFIPIFLPDFSGSINIFKFALPGLVLSSSITVIKHNFYKISNKNTLFFATSSIIIFVILIMNFFAYRFFGTLESIALSSFFGLLIWYILTEMYMYYKFKIQWKLNSIFLFFSLILFFLLSSFNNFILGGILYAIYSTFLLAIVIKGTISVLKTDN